MYQETSSFFKWIWRFNAVMIFMFGLCALAAGAFTAFFNVSVLGGEFDETMQPLPPTMTEITEQNKLTYGFELDSWQPVQGRDLYLSNLFLRAQGDASSSSYQSDHIVNVAFLKPKTGEVTWAFDTPKAQLVRWDMWKNAPQSAGAIMPVAPAPSEVRAFLFSYANPPLEGDLDAKYLFAQSGEELPLDLYVTDAEGQNGVVIAKGVDRIQNFEMLDEKTGLLIFTKDGNQEVVRFGLDDFRVLSKMTIALP